MSVVRTRFDSGGGDTDWLRGRAYLKPEGQLQLSEEVCLI